MEVSDSHSLVVTVPRTLNSIIQVLKVLQVNSVHETINIDIYIATCTVRFPVQLSMYVPFKIS